MSEPSDIRMLGDYQLLNILISRSKILFLYSRNLPMLGNCNCNLYCVQKNTGGTYVTSYMYHLANTKTFLSVDLDTIAMGIG